MDLHKLLLRQLGRLELSETTIPTGVEQWQNILERVNQTYKQADQERYLLERSMEISSRELIALNDKLENAQHIARLGYWHNNMSTGKTIWSKELCHMLGFAPGTDLPNLEKALELVHEEDRPVLSEKIEKALVTGKDYVAEIRIKSKDEKYRWYYVIGHPHENEGKISTEISGIAMDITHRKEVEEEVVLLHQQIISSARRAGMADVATSILHNVGNVLNSVNVSLLLISEKIHETYFEKLYSVEKMIKNNLHNLADYFTNDSKGKLIPPYLISIINEIKENQRYIIDEVMNLSVHIQHIKDITAMQKSLSGVSGIIEKVSIPEVIDTAILMCGQDPERNNISIIKNFEKTGYIFTDKTKLLQILVNLIQNAKDALLDVNHNESKKITIIVNKSSSDSVMEIIVNDNGVGIDPDNLTKIFAFGFTTKLNGHGFGLHSGALSAKELGGTLVAKSDGQGCGASFILTLPLTSPSSSGGTHNEPERKKITDYSNR